MNYKILLTSTVMLYASASFSQNSNKAFAITGDGHKDFMWMNIRQVDLGTGEVSKTIFERNSSNFVLTDITAKTSVTKTEGAALNFNDAKNNPTGSFVAAAALDRRSNRQKTCNLRSWKFD